MREPCTHLAGAADDQDTFAGAAGLRGYALLFLVSQRGTYQSLHDLFREPRIEP